MIGESFLKPLVSLSLLHFLLLPHRTGLLGYAAHLMGLLTNVIAFSVVIYLWTSIISYKQDVTPSRYILSVFLLLNIGCTLAGVIDLCESTLQYSSLHR
jgi:hypothetical protein